MRRITFFKTLLVVIALVIGSVNANAQLLVEDFNYNVGSVLTATATADPTTGWMSHSGLGTANIDVTSGLSFAGYAGSGIGGAANVDNNGQDINKTFTSQTSGSVYAAFMIQTQSTNNAGYFFMFSPSPVSTSFTSRLWVNATGDGIALGTYSSPAIPPSFVSITAGVPVLLVVKYDFTANLTSLYVLNSFSATEPAIASQTYTETAVIASIGGLALRQFNAAEKIIVDGIRVGTSWSDACAAPGMTEKVATPTFSITPGNVISAQSVTLSSTTASASIYYTTDGTTPDNLNNGTLYDGQATIAVSSTETIKAIAYFSGMDASSVAVGVYNFPTVLANIGLLRAASTSGFYQLTGEALLTFQSAAGKAKYIQDATGAILIYDGNSKITTSYNIGDGIKDLYCTLSMYNGMLELIPFTDPGVASSTNNTVTPVEVTLDNLANYEGQLVKVINVSIAAGTFAAATNSTINVASLSGFLRPSYTDLDYIGTEIPTVNQDITGVVLNLSTTQTVLVPRSSADFTASITGISNQGILSFISASNGVVTLSAKSGETVEIYNAVGQKLSSKLTLEGLNRIQVAARGVVIVKVGNRIAKVIL